MESDKPDTPEGYVRGIRDAQFMMSRVLRQWEHDLMEKHDLHGHPTRGHGMPLIADAAKIAQARMIAYAAIEKLLHDGPCCACCGFPEAAWGCNSTEGCVAPEYSDEDE